MPLLIAVAGFLGGWLLVAGPVYQAAVELDEERFDRTEIAAVNDAVPPPPPISTWWWLLPPVAMTKQRRLTRAHREAMLHHMTTEQLTRLLRFGAKATGWLIVALGAACIAAKETWEIVELLEWPSWSFIVLLVAACAAAVIYAPLRRQHDQRMLRRKAAVDAGPGA